MFTIYYMGQKYLGVVAPCQSHFSPSFSNSWTAVAFSSCNTDLDPAICTRGLKWYVRSEQMRPPREISRNVVVDRADCDLRSACPLTV